MWLISVHGTHATWVKNLEAQSEVRLKHRRRWHRGTASVEPFDAELFQRFNRYARLGPSTVGIDTVLVRVDFVDPI